MTAQIQDSFRYRKKEFSLAGISEGEVLDLSILGLKPTGCCTACWRGYQAIFAIAESRLVLDTLHVNLVQRSEGTRAYEREEGPVINEVKPTGPKGKLDWFNNHYHGLNYHLEYTGGLLLADGFIRGLYVHMGFHPAWKYEKVIELVFVGGVLKEEFDRSERMKDVRELIESSRDKSQSKKMPTDEDVKLFVERSFDRSYRM